MDSKTETKEYYSGLVLLSSSSLDTQAETEIDSELLVSSSEVKVIYKIINKTDHSFLLRFFGNTRLNPFYNDIQFSVLFKASSSGRIINSIPVIKCLSNFYFPSFYDNRDLHELLKDLSKDSDIILMISNFLFNSYENLRTNTLVYYGGYKINSIYSMNDFLINSYIHFFKVNEKRKVKKNLVVSEKYLIITHLFVLIFEPVEGDKSMGKLIFYGDIRGIKNSIAKNLFRSESMVLEWVDSDKPRKFSFDFTFTNVVHFMDTTLHKIQKLEEKYEKIEVFQSSDNSFSSISSLTNLLSFMERIEFDKKKLLDLYIKLTEDLNLTNDCEYTLYVSKIKNILKQLI